MLTDKTYVYNFQTLKLTEKIETAENPKGLCAVCSSKDVCVTASPVLPVGSVRVIHFDKNSKSVTIKAH